jgi:molecular chaperone HtpG
MERIMKAQALRDTSMGSYMTAKKTMELNPSNGIIKALVGKVAADATDKSVRDFIWLLYESSLLTSGFNLEDPNSFAKRLHHILEAGMNVESAPEEELPELAASSSGSGAASTMEEVD